MKTWPYAIFEALVFIIVTALVGAFAGLLAYLAAAFAGLVGLAIFGVMLFIILFGVLVVKAKNEEL